MSSGGVFKRRRVVCLAGLSGASRNHLVNRLPTDVGSGCSALSLSSMGRFPSRIRISRLFFSLEPILIAKASRLLDPANGTW
jgi:hypothetical protein